MLRVSIADRRLLNMLEGVAWRAIGDDTAAYDAFDKIYSRDGRNGFLGDEMDWIIKPYESFGPLTLGMSPDEVKDILGPSMKRKVLSARKFREIRVVEAPRLVFDHERLVEIELNPRAGEPVYIGLKIFSDDSDIVRKKLLSADGGIVFQGAGTLVFLNLGISTGLFLKDQPIPSDTVCVFERGYWDDAMNILKPL